jgi:hypothetical protein
VGYRLGGKGRPFLEYTGAGDGARLMMLVLHDNAARELHLHLRAIVRDWEGSRP